jgi:hypothetical protein
MRALIEVAHIPGLDQDSATISACGQYRHTLTRGWGPDPRAVWIMLNPSTADASHDDPTIRRCKAFSRSWGCGALTVVNLYGWRATDPAELKTLSSADAIGPENDATILTAATTAQAEGWPLVAAWGANADRRRVVEVLAMVTRTGAQLQCLGTTKGGQPRHPLFVRGDTPLVAFSGGR